MGLNINDILDAAFEHGASDIHLKVGIKPYFRVKGQLIPGETNILSQAHLKEFSEAILNDEARVKLENEGQVDDIFRNNEIRYRVNAFKDEKGIGIAIRVVPSNIPNVRSLGFPYEAQIWGDIVNKIKNGLILVTGPTNSGKTTTLASLIQEINITRSEHIITLEDPIEYVHSKGKSIITQREIGKHSGSYEVALNAALREDPNVIMIGEIRTREAAFIALRAAMTGNLVFTTRHSGNTSQAITEFASFFPPEEQEFVRYAIASCGKYIISQRLTTDSPKYSRRVIMEVMNIQSNAIQNQIREKKDHLLVSTLQTSHKEGMITLQQHATELYKDNKISLEDALLVGARPAELGI